MGPTFEYRAEILRVVDGDTVIASLDLGMRISVVHELRLLGLNAPELTPKQPKKGWTTDQLAAWQETVGYKSQTELHTLLDLGGLDPRPIVAKTHKNLNDKYGRWLVELFIQRDDGSWMNVNKELVARGHAVEAKY